MTDNQGTESRFIGANKTVFPELMENYSTKHHIGKRFQNDSGSPRPNAASPRVIKKMVRFLFSKDIKKSLPVRDPSFDFTDSDEIRVWWLGHACNLIQAGTRYILTDPVFEKYASPVPGMVKRVTPFPISLENLPPISVVLISHCHWDHLSESSLKKLFKRFPGAKFMVPIGVSRFLTKWGIPCTEFDWRTKLSIHGVTLYCLPAFHGSARWGYDYKTTLWCSWIISFKDVLVYFPGDTAIGPHFKEIHETFGRDIDLFLGPIGPQEPHEIMRTVHLDSEEMHCMSKELHAKKIIPMHYGTFPLGLSPEKPDLEVLHEVFEGDDRLIVLEVGGKVVWNGSEFTKA